VGANRPYETTAKETVCISAWFCFRQTLDAVVSLEWRTGLAGLTTLSSSGLTPVSETLLEAFVAKKLHTPSPSPKRHDPEG
jgi:hypothetical protein